LISPKENSVVSSRPMFRWEMADTVNSRYELVLTDARGTVTTYSPLICNAEGVNCEEGEVFFSPANPLAAGAYTARLAIQGSSTVTEVHFTIK
ncbi:MAG: hypothetical protein IKP86_02755, partial [Anaerolineaceae bacterium]|nr:hypothetical protein [Anaerolineaceae bacterium]